MSEAPFVLLLDHGRIALPVLDRIRSVGCRVAALGGDTTVTARADHVFSSVDEIARITPELAGILCFADQSKAREREIGLRFGLPVVSADTLKGSRDKARLREILRRSGVDDLNTRFIPDSMVEIALPERFPIVMKPNFGFASTGVAIARDAGEFHKNLSRIRRLNRMALSRTLDGDTGTLCEPYLRGVELAIDSLTVGGATRIFGISHRLYAGEGNFQDFVYHTDPEVYPRLAAELTPLIEKTVSALGYRGGPSHIEVRFDPERKTWHVLDVGLRVGAGGNIGLMIERAAGVPYLELAISASLGRLSERKLSFLAPRSLPLRCFLW
ncbi:MAG: ATP-grasp domain-containing protein [Calothrix sp. SM1_5_4]|nr:ATP-grasp domain-containing protein [Calothrix sp. SM1_5_4]